LWKQRDEMIKILLAFLTGIAAGLSVFAMASCTTQDWKCQYAPKLVATFSVGDRVAFTKGQTVWDAHSRPQSFWVDKGDTGVVIDISYFETFIIYHVLLDKSEKDEYMVAHAHEGVVGGIKCYDLRAIVYPDPALAPSRGKQKE
jgi:hypothetical protein